MSTPALPPHLAPDQLHEVIGVMKILSQQLANPGTGRLWTVEEVAEHLGVPVATIYRWRHHGIGPRGHRVGKHLRYRAEDVDAWVQEQD